MDGNVTELTSEAGSLQPLCTIPSAALDLLKDFLQVYLPGLPEELMVSHPLAFINSTILLWEKVLDTMINQRLIATVLIPKVYGQGGEEQSHTETKS